MRAVLVLLLCFASYASSLQKLQEVYSWNVLDWNYPDEQTKQRALLSGNLIPQNALPVGIERWGKKVFVTVPRWRPGIPATLNTISLDAPYEVSPKLTPYPSWAANELGNCENGLTTTYRLKADKCNRLWVLDTGTYGIGNETTNPCPYALNIFDLNTDRRIRRYVLRAQDINVNTFIANIAVDIGKSCEDSYAYFSDELGYGLIAYSFEKNKSWRFDHSYFMPDPLKGDFNVAGLNFQWGAEGIFGISVSPIKRDGFRDLYFNPIASHRSFAVSTRILRDETRVSDSYHDFKVLDERGPNGHLASTMMDESGILLMTMVDQNAIGCWNEALPYKPQNHAVVDRDDVALVYPSDVNIDADKNVWVISDRMPVFLEAELDYKDINFRIFTAPLEELIKGTVCEMRKPKPKPLPIIAPTVFTLNVVGGPLTIPATNLPPANRFQNNVIQPGFQPSQNFGNLQNSRQLGTIAGSRRPELTSFDSREPQTFTSTPNPNVNFLSQGGALDVGTNIQELRTNQLGSSFQIQSSPSPLLTDVESNREWWPKPTYQVYEGALRV